MASMRHNRKRKRGRRRFSLLFKLLCAAALVAAATLGATVFFQVETIAVAGNSRYSSQEVIDASGVQVGDNLFQMNKNQISQRILQQLPYIGAVSPQRSLPSTLTIQVTEIAAAARIETYQDDPAPQEPEEEAAQEDSSAQEDSAAQGDSSGEGEEEPDSLADQPWLVSVSGKLLEPAAPSDGAPSVTGLTLLAPQAGTMAAVPQEQQYRLDALKELLSALEEMGQLEWVSSIDLTHSTWIGMRYRENFDARLPLGEDLSRSLSVLSQAVENTIQTRGDRAAGTMDLTQELADAIFTPAEG